jgi:hypothetical protein
VRVDLCGDGNVTTGMFTDIPEHVYHSDACNDGDETRRPTLSVSIAQALVLESPDHAYLRHPKLGGQPMRPTTDMDRGTLIHALLLGKGREVSVVECDAWTKKKDKEAREYHRSQGRTAVTRKLYDAAGEAAEKLSARLDAKGYKFDGHSEATFIWREAATNGADVLCRCRVDHVTGADIYDLKITGDANPRTLTRGHLTRMGYDIQGAAYPRALADVDLRLRGRTSFTLLFCEPEPPYCVTPVCFAGSMRELGSRKWQRAIDTWERCTRTGVWGDYTDSPVFAEARPWELEEEGIKEANNDAAE